MSGRPSSACSPGSEDSTSPLRLWDSDASDRSRSTSPADGSLSDGGPTYRSGETLLPTPMVGDSKSARNRTAKRHRIPPTGIHDGQTLTDVFGPISSAAASRASQSPPPAVARPRTTTAGSGPSSPVSFALLDPDGSWLKTYPDSSVQGSLLGPPLRKFFGTWPRWGSMHAGEVFEHPTLERPTVESGSSFLHTPNQMLLGTPSAADALGGHLSRGGDRSDELLLKGQVKSLLPSPRALLPTPSATPYGNNQSPSAGATVRPSLDGLMASLGDPTNPPSEDGKP